MRKQNKKINYNPLKMWGSWAGAVAGLAIGLITPSAVCSSSIQGFVSGCKEFYNLPILISLIIAGFLLGWAIHSLCRYLKNRSKN